MYWWLSYNFVIWNNQETVQHSLSILAQRNHSPIIKYLSMVCGIFLVRKLIQFIFLKKYYPSPKETLSQHYLDNQVIGDRSLEAVL